MLAAKRETQEDVEIAVAAILDDVRARGDAALLEYTARFDRVTLTAETMRVTRRRDRPRACLDRAAACSPRSSSRPSGSRISTGGSARRAVDYTDAAGVRLGARWTAIAAVGLYVPGGTAAYPSSVLMNALPAKVAGVERVAMVGADARTASSTRWCWPRPASPGSTRSTGSAARRRSAALAYGTETIRPVDKIVGPGNAYVAAAKRRVFGTVGIDMIAGPSEILVVADGANDPAWIAADLLSQAEHDTSGAVDPDHRRRRPSPKPSRRRSRGS